MIRQLQLDDIDNVILLEQESLGTTLGKSMLENTAVEQVVPMPGDAKLMVTVNPLYSYIETPDGLHVSEYNGMKASDWAQPYVEEAQKNAKQM